VQVSHAVLERREAIVIKRAENGWPLDMRMRNDGRACAEIC